MHDIAGRKREEKNGALGFLGCPTNLSAHRTRAPHPFISFLFLSGLHFLNIIIILLNCYSITDQDSYKIGGN